MGATDDTTTDSSSSQPEGDNLRRSLRNRTRQQTQEEDASLYVPTRRSSDELGLKRKAPASARSDEGDRPPAANVVSRPTGRGKLPLAATPTDGETAATSGTRPPAPLNPHTCTPGPANPHTRTQSPTHPGPHILTPGASFSRRGLGNPMPDQPGPSNHAGGSHQVDETDQSEQGNRHRRMRGAGGGLHSTAGAAVSATGRREESGLSQPREGRVPSRPVTRGASGAAVTSEAVSLTTQSDDPMTDVRSRIDRMTDQLASQLTQGLHG
eukprot:CAMPEP_0198206766 /NCGR_PEP_ID=MMETSP1445-20131203/10318_1 /TAXON_ID=36898 /ORGANISM="Pyramimonas sp., Strain CCMP2087" /LENGTH=267 /DNA_ID=CAMNT_0043879599 /DNA_START=713 /DNA_END=1512 /DNA_ORIENTATION=-